MLQTADKLFFLQIRETPGEGFPLFNCFTIENSPILRFGNAGDVPLSCESASRLRLENPEAFL